MNINIHSKNINLTEDVKDYALKKVTNLEKFLANTEKGGGEVSINFEISKSTKHHNQGQVFHADCLININGEKFYASADAEDEKTAIDEIKEKVFQDITKKKNKKEALFFRGARKVKDMMKGLRSYRPWKK
ncbi:ribosomal subunit interface protein [Candidatus Nomurabacteria bacterium RIFCSPLOWO2_01_FULL_41_21]|uniref:Ribosomal subunit interface protein n=2 Tax=Candidatus Nomuraibacteriota TaxID=1752729 RepID=A0A1F6V3E8_9BACT|nr:MAG: ribosomal subunit interface protein [Candidatus Nomurabacteria bacterium RIFCSPHIGHO2_01_FULL_40_20]OGI88836.1 MAG: ribosomal subunit interface protein [Candidatus Nomurabacteria bacterium RIFCSPLOWO2_01_FULL_41_21]